MPNLSALPPLREDRLFKETIDQNDINALATRVNVVSGRVTNLALDSLVDVAVGAPTTTKYLAFDPTQGLWIAVDPPTGGGTGGAVSSVAGRTGAVTLTKSDVGLANVANLAPADLGISVATQNALDAKAGLVNGKIPVAQLPAVAISDYLGVVASTAAMLALTGQRGDFVSRSDTTVMPDGSPAAGDWILTTDDPTTLASWHRLSSPATTSGGVTSVNGKTGPAVALVISDIIPSTVKPVVFQLGTDAARGAVPAGAVLFILGGTTPPTWKQPSDIFLQGASA